MRRAWLAWLALVLLGGCDDDTVSTDPGDGSGTLRVEARVHEEDGDGAARLTVTSGGAPVTGATVRVWSNLGEIAVSHQGLGIYTGRQGHWGAWYRIEVRSTNDWLTGTVAAPVLPDLLAPDATQPIDAHLDTTVHFAWSGAHADEVSIRTRDFEWQGSDVGSIDVPSTEFTETSDFVEIARTNETSLAGGVVGSDFRVECDEDFDLIVVNPY